MGTDMPPNPKPTKADRIREKSDTKSALYTYRKQQYLYATHRDNGNCVFCWFLLGDVVPAVDHHHVYSRGREAGDWRESYRHIVCTCRRHHPLPIQTPGGNPKLSWVEGVLKMANDTPINKGFTHVGD